MSFRRSCDLREPRYPPQQIQEFAARPRKASKIQLSVGPTFAVAAERCGPRSSNKRSRSKGPSLYKPSWASAVLLLWVVLRKEFPDIMFVFAEIRGSHADCKETNLQCNEPDKVHTLPLF